MAIIGVMGSGSAEWEEFAVPLGVWIAQNGHDLLTGAGKGVMLSASRAFSTTRNRTGRSIGIVPTCPDAIFGFVPIESYPNPFVDLPILTPLPRKDPAAPPNSLNRNYVNVLTSDVVIALPGGQGTLEEIILAARFAKPVMCLGPAHAFLSIPPTITVSTRLDDIFHFISTCVASRLGCPVNISTPSAAGID